MSQVPDTPTTESPLPDFGPRHRANALKEVRKHRSFASFRAIGALILREMQTSHGRAAGGYVWAIAEPVGGIVLLTLIFSLGFRTPPIGVSFAIFYATGVLPFMGFLDISNKVTASIRYSKALLNYPAVTFIDALLARIIFNAITQIIVATIVFSGIYVFMDTRTDPQIDQVVTSLLMMISLAAGVGAMNCFLFEAFIWWQSLWHILMRPMFLMSCIFFIFDDIPQPYQDWLWWNPLVHIVGQMRRAFFPSYVGDYVSHAYVFGLSLSLAAFGLTLLVRYHRDLQNS